MLTGYPRVTLPDGENIPTLDLTRRIAESLSPDLKNCEGVSCVVGIKEKTVAGVFQFKLTKADIESLTPLLADLPRVHACMSEQELNHFLSAYEKHPRRLAGTPCFVTQFHINQQQSKIESLDDIHREAIRKKIKTGEIKVYDQNHCPVDSLGIHVFSRPCKTPQTRMNASFFGIFGAPNPPRNVMFRATFWGI